MQATTTSDLLRQVRNQIREANPNGITDQEILDTLNRGQNRAVEVMTRNWIYNYLAKEKITTAEDGTFQIPEEARGNRIVNIEINRNSSDKNTWGTYSLKKLNYKNVSQYKNDRNNIGRRPVYYSVQGRTGTVYPQISYEIEITYVRNPEKIVKNSGYIYEIITKKTYEEQEFIPVTAIKQISLSDDISTVEWQDPSLESYYVNLIKDKKVTFFIDCMFNGSLKKIKATSISNNSELANTEISHNDGETYEPLKGYGTLYPESGFKTVEEAGDILDYIVVSDFDSEQVTVSDSYSKSSYFNIIDAQTGLVKISLQASPISGEDEITGQYKLYPMEPYKQKVLNRPITSPSVLELGDFGFEEDDQICSTYGSSVLEIDTILENFIIQYAVTEIRRSLGNQDMVSEVQVLAQFEKDIRRANLNRDNSRRIQFKTSTFVKGRYRFNLLR